MSVIAFPKVTPVAPTCNSVPVVTTVKEPVILTDPVKACVLANNDPNRVEPVTKSTELVIVCTTNVCAVKVEATVNAFANDAVAAETAFDADCAKATNDAVCAVSTKDAVCAAKAFDALAANDAEATEPDSVILPEAMMLPVTVSEPETYGELSIILFIF